MKFFWYCYHYIIRSSTRACFHRASVLYPTAHLFLPPWLVLFIFDICILSHLNLNGIIIFEMSNLKISLADIWHLPFFFLFFSFSYAPQLRNFVVLLFLEGKVAPLRFRAPYNKIFSLWSMLRLRIILKTLRMQVSLLLLLSLKHQIVDPSVFSSCICSASSGTSLLAFSSGNFTLDKSWFVARRTVSLSLFNSLRDSDILMTSIFDVYS